MASVYKRSRDKGRKGACWYFAVKDHTGKRKTRRGFTDRGATERLAGQLEEQSQLIRDGVLSAASLQIATAGKQPISDHLAAFEKHLQGRDVTPKQVHESITRLNKLFAGKIIGCLANFDATAVQSFLSDLRAKGPQQTNEQSLSEIGEAVR